MNVRYSAGRVIAEVMQGRSLSDCMTPMLITFSDARDRALLQAICYGTCRYYTRLNFFTSELLKTPLKQKDNDIYALLLIGLYQLGFMQVPHHAAVAETVAAVDSFKKTWAKGLVNAVLREYLRKVSILEEKLKDNREALYAHPRWWIEIIQAAYPTNWQDILQQNNQHPPFALRVNEQQVTCEAYLEKLKQHEYVAHTIPATRSGIIVENKVPVEALPGFANGLVSVQDGAAQLAAPLLMLDLDSAPSRGTTPHFRVLDACAAPGGKLTHMLELEPNLNKLIAIEKDNERLTAIKENVARLKLNSNNLQIICADASKINAWWDGQLFDRILLDAPCSGSGVIRRHPDIKLLRKPTDIAALAKEQFNLLSALWQTLKPGGRLLYATCSILPQENQEVIQKFLHEHPDAQEEKIKIEIGQHVDIGLQILPGTQQMDGFYYACIHKVKTEL